MSQLSQQAGAFDMFNDGNSYSSYYANGGGGNVGGGNGGGGNGGDGSGATGGSSAITENSEPDVQDPLSDISQLQGMPASPLLIAELQRLRYKLEEQFDVQRNFNARIERQLAEFECTPRVYESCELTYPTD